MNLYTSTDQGECLKVITELNIEAQAKPIPPRKTCDFMMQLHPTSWICGTNENGTYTIHLLTMATKSEAWAFFDQMREGPHNNVNPRIEFVAETESAATQN